MKQRFLNQKLGKRMSRKTQLQKARAGFWGGPKSGEFRKTPPRPGTHG